MAAAGERSRDDRSGGPAQARVKPPLGARLKAWWDGYDLEVRVKPNGPSRAPLPEPEAAPEPDASQRWGELHLDLLQSVWGAGFVTPGGEPWLLKLVKPFGLSPAMNLLDIGAGLGGPARLMAKTFGVWVSGLESRPHLAELGMALSVKAGMEKRAPVAHFDPEAFEGKPKSYDCVFAKECFFTIKQKDRLFQTIETLLKDTGHVLFTDFMLAKPGLRTPAIETWTAGEPESPAPWAMEEYVAALSGYNLDVRITEDITNDFQRGVIEGWAACLGALCDNELDHRIMPILVEEVELWTRRVQALESGDLRVCRIYAMRKGVGRLMSDW